MVRDDAIDLLGHPPVEAAQAGFHVHNRQLQLGSGESRGECRVRVAVREQDVRALIDQRGLELLEHAPGLLAM